MVEQSAMPMSRTYNHQVAISGIMPTAEDFWTDARPHGYRFAAVLGAAAVVDADGTSHLVLFQAGAEEVAGPPVWMTRRAGEGCFAQPTFLEGSYTGATTSHNDGSGTSFRAANGSTYECTAGPEEYRLSQGPLELRGRAGLAMNLMIPELDLYHPMVGYSASGEIAGRPIESGLAFYGGIFMVEGRTMADVDAAGYATWKDVWCMGMNVYDTGEREFVNLMKGSGDYAFVVAIAVSPGEAPRVTSRSPVVTLDIDSDLNDHMSPMRLVYRCADGDWEVDVAADGRVDGVPAAAWARRVQRAGDQRTLVDSVGIIEANLRDPQSRYGVLGTRGVDLASASGEAVA